MFRSAPPAGRTEDAADDLRAGRTRKLLERRNLAIKEYAETDKWKFLLNK